MNTGDEKAVKNIQSVHRALDILECISESGSGYRLGDLADRCQLNKTTAFHLLKTLEVRGYVEKSYDSKIYKLGWKSYDLFSDTYEKLNIRSAILPYMEEIRRRTDETVSLYNYLQFQGYYVGICIIQLESNQPLKFSSKLGSRIPLHCTAAGKVHLLCYSGDVLTDLMAKMPYTSYTPATTGNAELLSEQLRDIRQAGYCIEREEFTPGICSVAVPLFKYSGRISFSVGISVPATRELDGRLNEIAHSMMDVLRGSTTHSELLFREPPL